ncbi:FixH family protein [Thalassobacillus pellis]|uniref:FixH family protein n=1 Tax=Thalassobacillus pellis TaxID=748008 RepID=UPI001960DD97|nr:FixH family protein [Thalassobacillus pellis]MBM7553728.1 hypothetical protein [Thalassobacillus pellis]
MRKIIPMMCTLMIAMVLGACGQGDSSNSDSNEGGMEPMVEVKVTIPENIKVNEEVTFQAAVTQGKEKVQEADVKFEFWPEGTEDEEHPKIQAEHVGEGVYKVKHNFDKEGTYYLYAHTQARNMHVMPKESFKVGESEGHSHGGEKSAVAHLVTDKKWKASEESTLTAHVQKEGQPLTGAKVQFEIASEQLDKHIFIDATEGRGGEYKASYNFPSPGTYTIKTHYVKESLHGHQEDTIEVEN